MILPPPKDDIELKALRDTVIVMGIICGIVIAVLIYVKEVWL